MNTPNRYSDLIQQHKVSRSSPQPVDPEAELDSLVSGLKERRRRSSDQDRSPTSNPINVLREQTVHEFIPIFVELVEKYGGSGVSMQMDASNFLEGGREIRFDFALGDYRMQLLGTVTTEALAFHETRYSPEVDGELLSGPMLRLRNLTKETFRNFICERLTILLRSALRNR